MKTRIDILSGFLGAGKTTLLLKLLEYTPPNELIAVCENEYGEVGIDGDALKGRAVEVLEVNAGCVCCTLSGNLVAGLKLLIARHHPDRILLEPTGLANLAEILNILVDEGLARQALVGTAAAVLDGSAFVRDYDRFQRYFDAQLGSATVLFLNRTEGLGDEERLGLLETILNVNPHIRILAEPFTAAEAWQALSGPAGPSADGWVELPKSWLKTFKQASVGTGYPGSKERLESFTGSPLAVGLVRAKGHVLDRAGARFRVDYAGGRWACVPEGGSGGEVLQFIGSNLPVNLIRSFFSV